MSRRSLFFLALAAVAAVVCVRLGFWQLARLEQRRAGNAFKAARLGEPPVPLSALPRDTALAFLRRVTLRGTYDYAHEVAVTNRSRQGSPGVHIVTPLRVPGSDTAVLVNRGWVYAPDASTVDLARWREADTAAVTGFVATFPAPLAGTNDVPARPYAVRWLDRDRLTRRAGYPLAPFYVVLLGDTAAGAAGAGDSVPPRVAPPRLDEGSHLSYAVQWFSFATIAVVGAAIVVAKERRKGH